MRLKFLSSPNNGLPVVDSFDNQRVVGILIDDGNIIVMYVDRNIGSYYIERVINKFAQNIFESSNFAVIDDESYAAYHKFFVENGVMDLK